jgi:hypothetical protein
MYRWSKQVRFYEESLIRCLNEIRPRHSPAFVSESLLSVQSVEMLDQRVAEDEVERLVSER